MARRDWKKQLLRVKQIADQNLGRVEKTEALTADLQALEKKVELYGKVFSGTGKKLLACLQGQPGQDIEKRQKKLPEFALSNQLLEGSNLIGTDTLIGQVLQICGDAEGQVANKTLELELGIEKQVLEPIRILIENDIPAIQKHRKNLQKVVLDMDSAKTRYASVMKEQSKASGNNPQAATTKVDYLREEYEDACLKVDQCRDQLATEIYTFASREAELSKILLHLIKCQALYHKAVLDTLEKRIPQIEEQIQFCEHGPIFGKPIEDHLERSNRTIALVIEECVRHLITMGGLEEEGLFRIAGAANKIKKLKAAFDSEQCSNIAEEYDVHVIAGTLKLYLRELPDPLMKSSLYPDWMNAAQMPPDQRLQALADVIAKLPKANSENLKFLIKFLHKMSEFKEVNKMSTSNLSIVMGPNLIWPQGENGPSVLTTSTQSSIVDALISHCDYFFPEDVDLRQYMKDPIQEILPPVALRKENVTKPGEKSNKRHAISLTESPPFVMSMSASGISDDGSCVSDGNADKAVIRSDADDLRAGSERIIMQRSGRSGSDVGVCSNGSYMKLGYLPNGDRKCASDVNSDLECVTGLTESIKRTVTPTAKVAPQRGMHSDVYDTVFALQSLGDGWPDYLSRVRSLWDTHMHQSVPGMSANGVGNLANMKSFTSSHKAPSGDGGISAGKGTMSDEDFMEQIFLNTSCPEPSQPDLVISAGARNEDAENSSVTALGQADNKQSTPDITSEGGAISAWISSTFVSPTNRMGSEENLHTSPVGFIKNGNTSGLKGQSPVPPRRWNKKPAPPPPGDRPNVPAPPPPTFFMAMDDKSSTVPVSTAATASTAINLPYPLKPPEQHEPNLQPDLASEQQQSALQTDRPSEQQQPTVQQDRPVEQQQNVSRPDRPPSPTVSRPTGPPPERHQPVDKPGKPARPEKPEKPSSASVEKLYPSLSPTLLASVPLTAGKKSSTSSSGDHSPPQTAKVVLSAQPDVTEKPPLPPPPGVRPDPAVHSHHLGTEAGHGGHKRQLSGGTRPPRPQPPPPPPSKPASQGVDGSEKVVPSSGGAPDEQLPASPKPVEDTHL